MDAQQVEVSTELAAPGNVHLEVASSHYSGSECDQTAITERQRSGNSCSTSTPEGASLNQHASLRKTSSVKSRAALFEAMMKSPPEQTSCPVSPPRGIPIRRMPKVSAAKSAGGTESITSPWSTHHSGQQEVEMVDQGIPEAAQLAEPLPSDDTHVPHFASSSSAEIQPQQPSSPPGQAFESPALVSQRHVWGLAPSSAACVHTSSESSADTSSDDGIELQEQGHVEALENTIERLKGQLIEGDARSRASASALACKTQECESLMGVVRELTENRSKLACARTNLAERLAELQHEYMRLMRVADLSRVVSKENVAKAAKATRSLNQAQDEAVRQQSLIGYFKERNRNLKDENLELRERICLLERMDLLSYTHESVCMREFQLHALKETY